VCLFWERRVGEIAWCIGLVDSLCVCWSGRAQSFILDQVAVVLKTWVEPRSFTIRAKKHSDRKRAALNYIHLIVPDKMIKQDGEFLGPAAGYLYEALVNGKNTSSIECRHLEMVLRSEMFFRSTYCCREKWRRTE
jgi:hypothetical protein